MSAGPGADTACRYGDVSLLVIHLPASLLVTLCPMAPFGLMASFGPRPGGRAQKNRKLDRKRHLQEAAPRQAFVQRQELRLLPAPPPGLRRLLPEACVQ